MEVASSLAGAMKVGLQVATSYRGPHLEVYCDVLNLIGPEVEYDTPYSFPGRGPQKHRTRDRDVHIQFQLINIGAQRAENVRVTRSGEFKRRFDDQDEGDRVRLIPQMAPGQIIQLLLLDQFELDVPSADGRSAGFQPGNMDLVVDYDSPSGTMNFVVTLPARVMRRSHHHRTNFRFNAGMIEGDLPPARYA